MWCLDRWCARRGAAAAGGRSSIASRSHSSSSTGTRRRVPPLGHPASAPPRRVLVRQSAAAPPSSTAAAAAQTPASSDANNNNASDPPAAPKAPPKISHLTVRVAQTAAELRAAAYLRAAAFGAYPPGRSPFAARAHRRMRGDAEWEAVTAKVAGREPAYASMRVACLIATAPVPSPFAGEGQGKGGGGDAEDENAALAAALAEDEELDPSAALLPSSSSNCEGTVEAVIGTLDVNVGAVLPAEELVGRRGRVGATTAAAAAAPSSSSSSSSPPPPPPPPSTRAYLSNVCVAKAARGQGVGKALLRAAEELVVRPVEQGGLLSPPPPPPPTAATTATGDAAAAGGAAKDGSDPGEDAGSFHLYVHVVHDNAAARALYEGEAGGGFRVESEETEAFARGLARPRRLLLHKRLERAPL